MSGGLITVAYVTVHTVSATPDVRWLLQQPVVYFQIAFLTSKCSLLNFI